ncbi:MAG: hypothetical protein AAF548_03160 [Actinomycetota bacterium]
MQPASAEGDGGDLGRQLRRYGPLALIAIIVIVVVVVIASGGDDDPAADGDGSADVGGDAGDDTDADADADADADGSDTDADNDDADETPVDPDAPLSTDGSDGPRLDVNGRELNEGVVPLSWAREQGVEDQYEWGERCDLERGTIATPDPFSVECMAVFDGDNGGETAQGVTADTIKIVLYQAQEEDPILRYITSAIINDDTNAQEEETVRKLMELFETYYETYGRTVDLEVVTASGTGNDVAAAVADAKRVAEEIKPFMVWGGPTLTNAFAQELHANGIPCFGCVVGVNIDYYEENPGLAYVVGKGGEQLDLLVAEYVGKRLAGDPAIHAGDESMHETERVFGRVWTTTGEGSEIANARFEANLDVYGVEIAESQSYVLDPATLQESATSIITKLKDAGVTSVILSTDPIGPRDITFEATAQNYFPEWIVTGSVLVDTTAFARSYDQAQWENAFGVSNLSARIVQSAGGIFSLYEWFHGERPPADDTIGVLSPNPQTFYSFLQAVGPTLNIENFNRAAFSGVPTVRALTSPSLSWGSEGIWPDELEPDYRGVDDISEIWWDVDQPGVNEIEDEGIGMWRWVDGGLRFQPGEIPDGAPKAFVMEGSVDIYDERPADEQYPGSYEPLSPS